jgi:hypothetical protein
VRIVDPSPLNWLCITWNKMEEPIRIDQDGRIGYALAESSGWVEDARAATAPGRAVPERRVVTAHHVVQRLPGRRHAVPARTCAGP